MQYNRLWQYLLKLHSPELKYPHIYGDKDLNNDEAGKRFETLIINMQKLHENIASVICSAAKLKLGSAAFRL